MFGYIKQFKISSAIWRGSSLSFTVDLRGFYNTYTTHTFQKLSSSSNVQGRQRYRQKTLTRTMELIPACEYSALVHLRTSCNLFMTEPVLCSKHSCARSGNALNVSCFKTWKSCWNVKFQKQDKVSPCRELCSAVSFVLKTYCGAPTCRTMNAEFIILNHAMHFHKIYHVSYLVLLL